MLFDEIEKRQRLNKNVIGYLLTFKSKYATIYPICIIKNNTENH